ncbi:MAG: PAS-domain containing protein [Holosporaceae bacterium]|nr:PAS-domain containing protein [Holosporaceae bacterium]
MRAWSKTDIIGLFFAIFGIASFLFANSDSLTSIVSIIAAIILLYSVYNARYNCVKYMEILCHYQAVLSSSAEGWIAWNTDGEYIGSSKKIKSFFGMKSNDISVSDIMSTIQPKDADLLLLNFSKLRKEGVNFTLTVKTLSDKNEIQINGSRMIINNVETILFWCTNVTESSALILSMEQKLASAKKQLKFLKEILDALQMPVWKRDENLRLVYCNRTYSNYLNTSVEKILDNNIPLIPGNLFGHGHSLAENAKKANRAQSIASFIMINGLRKKILMSECPTIGGDFIGYANDITAEEALSVNFDKVVTANCEVLENLSTAIVIFGENMRIKFFNNAYQRLMKLEPEWLYSNPTYGEVLDELRNNRQLSEQADYQVYKKAQLALFTSTTDPIKELIHLPNGKTLRLTVSPYQLGGLLFVYEDVTDSLTLQRKNNMLLAVHKETINNLYEGVMVYGSDNRLKIVNKAMQKIWKMFDDDIMTKANGMHISELLDTIVRNDIDYGSNWEEFRENAISNLTDRITKTGKLQKKDGSIIQFSYIPLPDGAHMHSYTDITDTYIVERAVMEKNQALKTAQQLRLEFISGISIELKEPLNILIGFSELLLSQSFGTLNDKQMKYCKHLLCASNQLHQLINNLLEMVSIDIDSTDLDLSSFSINDVVEEVIQSLEKRILEKNLDFVKNYQEQHIDFIGDRRRIKQSIYNMLITVIKNAIPHGKVDIIITFDDENLKVVIKDDAINPHKDKSKIKKVFHRSSRGIKFGSLENDGISMPLVRSLIELHGGTLKVDSNIGEGTSVICSLPMKLQKHSENTVLMHGKSRVISRAVNE